MERAVDNRNILDIFCEEFCSIVEKYSKYIIVSGFMAIASGRTRGTEDIDMIVERIASERFNELFQELSKQGFVCMQTSSSEEAYQYLVENLSLRFTRKSMPVPEMEVKFAKDSLDEYQLQHRVKLPLTGLKVWFGDVNINIAFKEELLKSPKDLEDAKHLRIIYKEMLDEHEINRVKQMIRKLRL